MPFTVESGTGGKVLIGSNSVGEVTDWDIEKTVTEDHFGTSESGGYAKLVMGQRRMRGSINFKWDSLAASPIAEGSSVTLKLHTNATEFYSVPAGITSFRLMVNINDGPANSGTATFLNNGAWTEPTLS